LWLLKCVYLVYSHRYTCLLLDHKAKYENITDKKRPWKLKGSVALH
jgi:hypothetical protein